ncbi:MAG: DUF3108 domain-containing protein [Opitutales bacterium]
MRRPFFSLWALVALCLVAGGCQTRSDPSTDIIRLSDEDPALVVLGPDARASDSSDAAPPAGAVESVSERPEADASTDVDTPSAPSKDAEPSERLAQTERSAASSAEPQPVPATAARPPFRISERLFYDLKWEALKVGEALMTVEGPEEINGVQCYHLTMQIRTDPVIDLVYKVRTRIEGWTTLNMERTLLYTKRQQEGKTNRDVRVTFDWDGRTAHYTNWNRPHKPALDLTSDVFDPISAVYFFRTLNLTPGQNYQVPLTDGKKWIDGSIDALRYESVEVPLGKFDTVLVEPEVGDAGGVFKKSPDAAVYIWMSRDRYNIPVKMASSVVVGDFSAELREIEVEGMRGILPDMAYAGPPEETQLEAGPRR